MTDITEFIRARLDEDETDAQDAYYDGQMWVPEEEAVVAADRDLDPLLFLDRKRDARHVANWSPARVLAQVAAMRAVVDYVEYELEDHGGGNPYWYDTALMPILRHLAAIWRDHEAYDPAWGAGGRVSGMADTSETLRRVAADPALLEVGRKAIEDALVEFRDSRIGMLRNNGLVIKEKDGEDSDIIRLGPEDAVRIGLHAIAAHLNGTQT